MQEIQQTETAQSEDKATRRVLETVYCPRDGRRASVIFEMSDGLLPVRKDVAVCPLDTYSNLFDPPLGGNACDLPCLFPVGGRAFG
jgi:hypothetical protein